jgi:signal peptidase II
VRNNPPPGHQTDADRSPGSQRGRSLATVIGVAVLVAAVDQQTKLWALWHLDPHRTLPVLGDLVGLQLAFNRGAAFSLAEGRTWILSVLAALVIASLLVWAATGLRLIIAVGVGCLIGGAASNLSDRLTRGQNIGEGAVVDMINYADIAIGNVADIAILVGVVILAVTFSRSPNPRSQNGKDGPPGASDYPTEPRNQEPR